MIFYGKPTGDENPLSNFGFLFDVHGPKHFFGGNVVARMYNGRRGEILTQFEWWK